MYFRLLQSIHNFTVWRFSVYQFSCPQTKRLLDKLEFIPQFGNNSTHTNFRQVSSCENILAEIFYWVLIIRIQIYFVFSWRTDGLRLLLQEESCPNRSDLSSTIHPMVIASMHCEWATGDVEARVEAWLLGQLIQVQVLH